jgi:hypothetical protein
MNHALVWRLIGKDWYLNRATLAMIAAAGMLSIGVLFIGGETAAFVGLSAALIAAILLGVLLPMQTVVNERKKQNLPFVMSLPISPMEYTTAKIVGNVAAFVVLWLAIVAGVLIAVAGAGAYGLLPIAFIASLAPFVAFSLLLAVAIVLESEQWALLTMGACNVSYSFAWFFLVRVPGVKETLKSSVPIWSGPILMIVGAQLAVIAAAVGLTFYFQARKRDFI